MVAEVLQQYASREEAEDQLILLSHLADQPEVLQQYAEVLPTPAPSAAPHADVPSHESWGCDPPGLEAGQGSLLPGREWDAPDEQAWSSDGGSQATSPPNEVDDSLSWDDKLDILYEQYPRVSRAEVTAALHACANSATSAALLLEAMSQPDHGAPQQAQRAQQLSSPVAAPRRAPKPAGIWALRQRFPSVEDDSLSVSAPVGRAVCAPGGRRGARPASCFWIGPAGAPRRPFA
jgi:hypothetical protein